MAAEEREFPFTKRDFQRICELIRARAGINLAAGKEDMVYSRIVRRLRQHKLGSFAEYLDMLETADDAEWTAFTNALTTNLTSFFREAHHFDMLKQHLAHVPRGPKVLLWSAATSTGEEPYSMAMAACEQYGTLKPPVAILATDIDTQVLDTAQQGIYPIERLQSVSPARQKKFFRRGVGSRAGYCKVVDELRELITFRQLNLLEPRWGLRGPFEAIFCRNVMIYFDRATQHRILEKMVPLLGQDGLFFAGHSENFFHAADLITSVGKTVYRRTARAAARADASAERAKAAA
jgi:chemotaxis protein methyltransferase CheR